MNIKILNDWKKAKNNIISYFDKNGITIKIDDTQTSARAIDKKDNSVICFCYLDEEDIITTLKRIKPELNTEELCKLEKELDRSYKKYIEAYLKENNTTHKNKTKDSKEMI